MIFKPQDAGLHFQRDNGSFGSGEGFERKKNRSKERPGNPHIYICLIISNSHLSNLHILTSSHLEAGSSPDPELPRPQQQPQDQAGGLHRHHGRAQC